MTNKAKTYLKNIQEADTEKKLIGIEDRLQAGHDP